MPDLYQDKWITCTADDDVPRVAEIIRQLAGLSDISYAGVGPVI